MMKITYTSQVCYTDEDMETLRRYRNRLRNGDVITATETELVKSIHDFALDRYEIARGMPKKLLEASAEAGAPWKANPPPPPPPAAPAWAPNPLSFPPSADKPRKRAVRKQR